MMKIREHIHFPHPVLGPDFQDYVEGEFSAKFSVKEDFSQSTIEITVETSVSDAAIASLISSGKASAGVFINCGATYFNIARPIQLGTSLLHFPAGQLWGRVVVRPLIWSNEPITGWTSPHIHPEFSEDGFDISKGALLAIGDEIAFSVGRDKLAPIESIFEIRRAPTYSNGKMTVSLDDDKIAILMAPDVHETATTLRANSNGKITLMNSVYLPAIMEVLSVLSGTDGNYEGKRWHQAFVGKCEMLNIRVAEAKIFEDAQKLLEFPASALRLVADKVTE